MTTKQELTGAVERLNRSLEKTGHFVKIGHRNGYAAIDLYRLSDGGCINTIDAGLTSKQALTNIYNMCKVSELFTQKPQ